MKINLIGIISLLLLSNAYAGVVYEQSTNGGVIYVGQPSQNTTQPITVDPSEYGNVSIYPNNNSQVANTPPQDLSKPPETISLAGIKPDEVITAGTSIHINVQAPQITDATIELLLDGKKQNLDSAGGLDLKNLDRGSHTIQYSLKANDGTTLLQGKTLMFYVRQASELIPKPQDTNNQTMASGTNITPPDQNTMPIRPQITDDTEV